ncbi:MAG: hypothetical protein ACC662_03505 [Planctomycetota bacterium]
MSRWSKRMKRYERHILLGLVILLLVSFSIVGAVQCQGPAARAQDFSGSFQATPSVRKSVDTAEFIEGWQRYDRFRVLIGSPSLQYLPLLLNEPQMRPPAAAVWAHVMETGAARAAGYACGNGFQLSTAIRQAVTPRMGGRLSFTDALYDKFLRDYWRGTASDFQTTVKEVVTKDLFLRPLIDSRRYGISYEGAYEKWKKRAEYVNLRYVALRGRDFALKARKLETTRSAIQEQRDVLDAFAKTARTLATLRSQIDIWKKDHDGQAPAQLADLPQAGAGKAPEDAWGKAIRYVAEGPEGRLLSAGPDGNFLTSDDVTETLVDAMRTGLALQTVGKALVTWYEATGTWPKDLAALRSAPKEGALPPLAREVKDAWGHDLVLEEDAPEAETVRLRSLGPLGKAGDEDDVVLEIQASSEVVVPAPPSVLASLGERKDAWGRPFRVRQDPVAGWRLVVESAGPDGVFGTDDDVRDGNGRALQAYYAQPQVQSDFLLPARRRFEALYVHLPLVPDAVLRRMWEAFPDLHPTEIEAYDRWRAYHPEPYYGAENPGDPENGHGAAIAREIAPDARPTLVPDRSIFGPAPADLVAEDSPDRKPYLEDGWREILLREQFLEKVMNRELGAARKSQEALAAWKEARGKFEAGEGEDPGDAPREITFRAILEGELKPFLPGPGDAPYLGLFAPEEPVERSAWEGDPHVGDVALTITGLQALKEPDQYAAVPTILHQGQTKAILHNVEFVAPREPDLAEVHDEVFERYLKERQLDLARDALEDLRDELMEAEQRATEKPAEEKPAEDAPAPGGDADPWEKTLRAWAEKRDVAYREDETGLFIGPRPPPASETEGGIPEEEVLRRKQRDFVRQTGYETVRPASQASLDEGASPGRFGRRILRDGGKEGTDSVFLVQVKDRRFPPPEAFTPGDYALAVTIDTLGDLLRRGRGRDPKAPRQGLLPQALQRFFGDIDWLQRKFKLETRADLHGTR